MVKDPVQYNFFRYPALLHLCSYSPEVTTIKPDRIWKALNPKTPPYPESLEEEGIEGSVTLELLISKEGKVLKAKVIKSDHELFSESALKTVKNYRFSAGKLKDGSAVDSLIEFVIKFEISL